MLRWSDLRPASRTSAAPESSPRQMCTQQARCSTANAARPYARKTTISASRPASSLRTRAAMYDIAEATELVASAGGILLGAVGGSLYFVEKGSKGKVEEELQQAQAALKAKDAVIEDLQQQLEAAQKEASDLDLIRARQKEYDSNVLKLERALEIRDGQMASFQAVAQRQIAFLEKQVKELQKVVL